MARLTQLVTLLLLVALGASQQPCTDSSEISCSSESRCIPYRYICDSDADCNTGREDEDEDLCSAWKQNECSAGDVQCNRYGSSSCVEIKEYCAPDSGCDGDLDPRICKMIQDGVIVPLAEIKLKGDRIPNDLDDTEDLAREFVVLLNDTIQHQNCPTMFTLVENQCVSLFFVGSVSWGEARAFCQVLGGDLITFRDVSHFTSIVRQLQDAQLTVDFWVGGSLANETAGWFWIDGTPVEMGTPSWAVRYEERCQYRNVTFPELNQTRLANDGQCYHYRQAPYEPARGHCLSLSYEHYHYMTDENCMQKKSPLCVLPEENVYVEETVTESA